MANQKSRGKSQRRGRRARQVRLRSIEALGLYRSGKAKSPSAAVRMARTTLKAFKESVPRAITQDRPGGRIDIKPSDPYSVRVEILTESGAVVATARGYHQRQLAGQHRATAFRIAGRQEPPSALEQFRGKKVGGYELLSNYERLRMLAKAGVLGQLDTLYVSAGGGQ